MFSTEDIRRVRQETPGLGHRVHLDNCGSSLMPEPVVSAMKSYLDTEMRLGGYVAQEQQLGALSDAYDSLSTLFGGKSTDYALASSAVDAWTKAFYSIPLTAGDNIVTVFNDYCSNYVGCLQRAKRHGAEIRVARAKSDGTLDLDHLADLVDSRTRIISLAQIASSDGLVADAAAVGKIAAASNAFYLLDACQAVGQIPVNFAEIGCHMATATSRKFLRGPRGIGFLYVNAEARAKLDPVILTNKSAAWVEDNDYELATDASMFEAWEKSCMVQLGFGHALKYFLAVGVGKATGQTQRLAADLRERLKSLRGIKVECPEAAQAAIITFNKEGWDAADVRVVMAEKGVTVQVSTIFHTRLDYTARGIQAAVRVSPHYYNTPAELDQFLNTLEDL